MMEIKIAKLLVITFLHFYVRLAGAAIIPLQDILQSSTSPPSTSTAHLPVIVWHGLGDNYKADGLRSIATLLNETNPATYTYFIRIDEDPSSDRTATFLGNLTEQIDKVCSDIATHPILSHAPALNALGFSQGGQFLRGYVERCNTPPIANLVTFGAQHNGISEFQDCATNDWICLAWIGLLKRNTWSAFAQRKLVPAQYFRDPEDLEAYLEYSNFLADVNNEREVKNETYKTNMKRLENFVMYMFEEDTVVVPKQSAWFGGYNETEEKEVKLRDREIYHEDWLGLRWLDEMGRLHFEKTGGKHMQLDEEVLKDAFKKWFGNVTGEKEEFFDELR